MPTNKPKLKLEHVEEALRRGAGIPSAAAQILARAYGSCTGQTVRNYMKRHPKLREAVEEQVETNIDVAEAKLVEALNNGAEWAVKFYLETKGKHRGYSKRLQLTGAPDAPPVVVTDARTWLERELDGMEARLRSQPGGTHGHAGPAGPSEAPQETVH